MAEVRPVTCAGCGLLCDDVILGASQGRARLVPECALGAEWFSERMFRPAGEPAATINGQPVEVDAAVARAAEVLRGARRPLLRGFDHATIEDARAAVALADRLGALVVTGGDGAWPGMPAFALRGASTATLGEIRDRSELVIIWREDPETTHPRLLGRLGFTGEARDERLLAVIDDQDTVTARRAGVRLGWPRERDLEALTSLHVLQRGLEVRPGELAADLEGLMPDLKGLMHRLGSVGHVSFVYGAGLIAGAGGQRRALALHELVRALCRERHAVTLELPAAPGGRSAGDVLSWQSGYGGTVDFASGHPEAVMAAQQLEDVDVTLRVESGPAGSVLAGSGVEVWIRTAAAGVEVTGTAHRLDGVPLTLQAPLADNVPTAAALLTRLLAEVER